MRQFHSKKKDVAAPESVRAIAVRCLTRWAKGGIFAETLIDRSGATLSSPDRALLQAIVLGTLRHLRRLEYICNSLRQGKLEDAARWPILTGLCQLL